MNGLHPIFAEIMSAHGMPQDASRREQYIAALCRFDWQFAYSDDYRYVRTQRAILKILEAEREAIDPDFEIWNTHTPVENWNGRVAL